ncbi:MAG: hypothetical protein IPO26_18870 [Saprospiraceae bacterium]|nr:hypothetical protein [Saprospiraceae bacterium]
MGYFFNNDALMVLDFQLQKFNVCFIQKFYWNFNFINRFLFTTALISQTELIEVDSVSKLFTKIVPIDKPFTVKYKIEKGNVFTILKIEKEKGSFIGSSIKSGRLPDIEKILECK